MNDLRCKSCNKLLMKLSFGLVEVKCPKCGVLSTYKVYSQKAAITIDTAQPDIS